MSDIRVEDNLFDRLKRFPNSEALLNNITSVINPPSPPSGPLLPSTSSPILASSEPFYDKISLTLVSSANTSSEILSEQYEAHDQVLGRTHRNGENIREIIPEGLYLPQLAFIIDAVHNQGPLYSLCERHCYWFANLICDAIVSRFPSQDFYKKPVRESDILRIPDDRPNLAGRWRGILIHNVKGTVLPHVLEAYDVQWLAYETEVNFFSGLMFNSNYLLNSR